VGLLAGQNPDHFVVHAQQQGDHLAHAAAVEGGENRGGRRGADGVLGAGHRHGGGGAGRGAYGGDPAGGLLGVDPDGLGVLVVVVDVVLVQLGGGGDLLVAVDGGGGEGQLGALSGHKGALQIAHQDGRDIRPAVGDGDAQGVGVELAVGVLDGEGIVEQLGALFHREDLALGAGQVVPQAQLVGFIQLGGGEGSAQGSHIIAQQVEDSGAGLLQGDGGVGAEAAVSVAAHPSLLDCDALAPYIRIAVQQGWI